MAFSPIDLINKTITENKKPVEPIKSTTGKTVVDPVNSPFVYKTLKYAQQVQQPEVVKKLQQNYVEKKLSQIKIPGQDVDINEIANKNPEIVEKAKTMFNATLPQQAKTNLQQPQLVAPKVDIKKIGATEISTYKPKELSLQEQKANVYKQIVAETNARIEESKKAGEWIKSKLPPVLKNMPFEQIKIEFPGLIEKKQEEYKSEKIKSEYIAQVASQFDKDITDFLGKENVIEKEKAQAWSPETVMPSIVENITFGLVNEKAQNELKGDDIYIENGKMMFNGFEIGDEFMTKEGQAEAAKTKYMAGMIASFAPYMAISNAVKSGVKLLATKSTNKVVKKIAEATIKATENYPLIMEATAYNLAETGIEAGIRKGTGQDYTFGTFLNGLVMQSVMGTGFGLAGKALAKISSLVKPLGEDIEYNYPKIADSIETELKNGGDINSVKQIEISPGVIVDDLFKEKQFAFLNKPQQPMPGKMTKLNPGKEQVLRPGIEKSVEPPKVNESTQQRKVGEVIKDSDTMQIDYDIAVKNKLAPPRDKINDPFPPSMASVEVGRWMPDMVGKKVTEDMPFISSKENVEAPQPVRTEYVYKNGQYVKAEIKTPVNVNKKSVSKAPPKQESVFVNEVPKEKPNEKFGLERPESLFSNNQLPDRLQKPVSEIFDELSVAEVRGGQIVRTESGFTRTKTPFPSWLPKDYQDRKLVNGVMSKLQKGELLTTPKEKGLLDVLTTQVENRTGANIRQFIKTDPQYKDIGVKKRGFTKNVEKAPDTTKETKDIIEKDVRLYYGKEAQVDTVAKAQEIINGDESVALLRALKDETATDRVVGMALIKRFQQKHEYDKLNDLMFELSQKATTGGQKSNILKLYSILTPEGVLERAVHTLKKAFDEGEGKIPKENLPGRKRYEDLVKRILDRIEKKFSNTEIKFTKQNVIEDVKAMLKDVKMTEADIDKILSGIEKKFNNTEIKFTKQNVIEDVKAVLKEAEDSLKFLKKYELTPEQITHFTERVKSMNDLIDGSRERDFATAEIMRDIAELIPSSWAQKLSTYQSISLLLNAKTIARNLIGNTMFKVMEEVITNKLAATLDVLASGVTGKRTITTGGTKEYIKGAIYGAKDEFAQVMKGIDVDDTMGKFIEGQKQYGRTFRKPGLLKAGETALGLGLRIPDRFASEGTKAQEIFRQAKLAAMNAGIPNSERVNWMREWLKNPTAEAIDIASQKALYDTFQDENTMTTLFVKLKDAFNTVGWGSKNGKVKFGRTSKMGDVRFGLGDAILKYAKTPANLINRAAAYSPLGFVNAIANLVKKGNRQRESILSLSRGLVGSAIMAGTYTLANLGIITGEKNKDVDIQGMQRITGGGAYRVNTSALMRYLSSGFDENQAMEREGDTVMNYDSLQPISVSIAMGVKYQNSIQGQLKKGKFNGDWMGAFGAGIGAMIDSTNVLTEQPLFTGVKRAFGSNTEGLLSNVVNTGLDMGATFVPTFVKQIREYTDNVQRETYSENGFRQSMNLILNRIPFLSGTRFGLKAKKNAWGMDAENYQDATNSIFNVFFNPFFVTHVKKNNVNGELLKLWQETGETNFMPVVVAKKIDIAGKSLPLTADEYSKYQEEQGKLTGNLYTDFLNSKIYQTMTGDEKVKFLNDSLTNAKNIAKGGILVGRVAQGSLDYMSLSQSDKDKYNLYEALKTEGTKVTSNAIVEMGIIKAKTPFIFTAAKETPNMNKMQLGKFLKENGMVTTEKDGASMEQYRAYKRAIYIKSGGELKNVNYLLDTFNEHKTSYKKVKENVKTLLQNNKITVEEANYILLQSPVRE